MLCPGPPKPGAAPGRGSNLRIPPRGLAAASVFEDGSGLAPSSWKKAPLSGDILKQCHYPDTVSCVQLFGDSKCDRVSRELRAKQALYHHRLSRPPQRPRERDSQQPHFTLRPRVVKRLTPCCTALYVSRVTLWKDRSLIGQRNSFLSFWMEPGPHACLASALPLSYLRSPGKSFPSVGLGSSVPGPLGTAVSL